MYSVFEEIPLENYHVVCIKKGCMWQGRFTARKRSDAKEQAIEMHNIECENNHKPQLKIKLNK